MIENDVAINELHVHSNCQVHPYATITVDMDCTLLTQAGEEIDFYNADLAATYRAVVTIKGALQRHLCGELCLCVHIECIGPADPDPLDCVRLPLEPCGKGVYTFEVNIPANTLSAGECGQVCCFAAVLTSFTECGDPGHINCFCKGPCVMVHVDPEHG
jgi:hypothetical protein